MLGNFFLMVIIKKPQWHKSFEEHDSYYNILVESYIGTYIEITKKIVCMQFM